MVAHSGGLRVAGPASGGRTLVGPGAGPLVTLGAVRQYDLGHGPRRHGDGQAKGGPMEVPGRLDPAVRRVMHGLGPCEVSTGPGLDPETPVGGVPVEKCDAGDVVV